MEYEWNYANNNSSCRCWRCCWKNAILQMDSANFFCQWCETERLLAWIMFHFIGYKLNKNICMCQMENNQIIWTINLHLKNEHVNELINSDEGSNHAQYWQKIFMNEKLSRSQISNEKCILWFKHFYHWNKNKFVA